MLQGKFASMQKRLVQQNRRAGKSATMYRESLRGYAAGQKKGKRGQRQMKHEFGYTKDYLTIDGRPWFPVMGEMHYSRYRDAFWEESLRKIKAGGISIVSTYVIWIHHEEEEGRFDFSGCRDLGRFVELCRRVGLAVWLRLGPWVHGEVRNGGFPDWLTELGNGGVCLRSNDDVYLNYVRRFWEKVYAQVKGQMYADGGPVIGVQIENEYGHCGGLQGAEGEAHMRSLTALAKEIGFRVPYYTATGWGGACIGDLLPVMGGYCDAPWSAGTAPLPANENYVFTDIRNDTGIGSDYHTEQQLTFDETRFPYLTAELGGGVQVTAHRRPVVCGRDIGAMSLVKLGSGVALLGYYMYHGGSNPKGRLSTLQETRAVGDFCELPEINYDFYAPIRQYGMISDTYREIKLLSLFLQDFGEDFAALRTEIPQAHADPEDTESLRVSGRHDGFHGYVFYNNYQRGKEMREHAGVVLQGKTPDGDILFPETDIGSGEYGFFPYHMKLGDAVLVSALATPLCRLHEAESDTWVFYGKSSPCFSWKDNAAADVLYLSREEALQAWKVEMSREYLILADNFVWVQEGRIRVTGGSCTRIKAFPPIAGEEMPDGFEEAGQEGRFAVYERNRPVAPVTAAVEPAEAMPDRGAWNVEIQYPEAGCMEDRDCILWLSYAGKGIAVYQGEEKIEDHFYTGEEVPISLRYFGFPERLRVEVEPLLEEDEIYLERAPRYEQGRACSLDSVRVTEEFR